LSIADICARSCWAISRGFGCRLPGAATRRYRDATVALTASLHERPGWPTTLRFLAASYAHLGEVGKARDIADRLRAITPAVILRAECAGNSPFRDREQSALYAEGLRLAVGVV
jgi:hypothetical protein